jgi:hypothetical protein
MTTKENSKVAARMFLFDNTAEGRAGLTAVRKALNRGSYKILTWGRGSRANIRTMGKNVKLETAQQIAVYIKPKTFREKYPKQFKVTAEYERLTASREIDSQVKNNLVNVMSQCDYETLAQFQEKGGN